MSTTQQPRPVAEEMRSAAGPYVEAFKTFSSNGVAGDPAWLKDRRAEAIAHFEERGFPTTRQEEWRFTDVKPIARGSFARSEPSPDAVSIEDVDRLRLGGGDYDCVVFLNGHHVAALSSVGRHPDGVRLGSLRDALSTSPELVEEHLARYATQEHNSLAALNTAFVEDGAFLYVPDGATLERPVQFLFISAPLADRSLVSHPRNLFIVGREARATVVESYRSAKAGAYWTNAVTEAVVGARAKLDSYRVQREHEQAFHTAVTQSHQARDSVYSMVTFSFGALLSRHDIHATLGGQGADCTLDGLSMLRNRQHTDYHTVLEHAEPNCTSWEYFNGVFDDRARGIFNGRIIVQPGAQKTDSKQTNNNLLLSTRARADSQPQLEIYADDVKCTHGATLGPIDDEHMFYLQSRGLTATEARNLLTYGFGSEILSNVSLEPLRSALDAVVRRWLVGTG
ncbi:MAG: Fe-S cluster assembly protein SufD [Gemmatimonadota bacterium]|nr:Fe-S cluster assembly protein SufD [Gemmatimonadota bacterium]